MSGEVVKPGYKKTEMGAIPEDWKFMRFEDVMTGFFSGQTPSRLKPEYYKGEIPWITSTELNYNIITDTNEKITENAVKSKNLKKLPKGTFLFAITGLEAEGTRGKCALTGIEATTNQSCMALFPNRELITLYLFYYYEKNGDWYAFNYCQGTKQQSYTSKTAKKLPIAYPPLITEQHAIAAALSDADGLIGALETLIAKKRAIKQASMQQLLTGRTRLPGFAKSSGYKNTEVGVIPEDWEVQKIAAILENIIDYRGRTPRKLNMEWGGGDIAALSARNVRMGFIDFNQETHYGSEELYKRWMTSGKPKKGDIVVTMEAPLGNVALIPDNKRYILSQRTILLQPNSHKVNHVFLFQLLSSEFFQQSLQENATGSTAKGIQRTRFAKLLIPLPLSLFEQHAIAAVFSDIDAEIAALEHRLEKARQIKLGMMQQLLTGLIRLPALN